MKNELFENVKKVHFIGIGGIGVSALAKLMLLLGKEVSGSDRVEGVTIDKIKNAGANVYIGHNKSNLSSDVDMIIYSPAIPESNPERIGAKERNIPQYSYPEMLGLISKNKYTIAVSGTTGKTTTTAMLTDIFINSEKDPTVVIGSFLNKQKENIVFGKSEYFIVEACEYKRSFLNIEPDILVITNIEEDHLDYYESIDEIIDVFSEMIKRIPKDGYIVCNLNDENTQKAVELSNTEANIVDYSKIKVDFKMKVPGEHNQMNAKSAYGVGKILGLDEDKIKQALEEFSGTWRRFEYKGETESGSLVYDDYAHHPTEIKATLSAAREKFEDKKIIAIFQPHLYSRTKIFLDDFANSFNNIDKIIIADIYAAREKKDESIHSKDLIPKIKNSEYIKNFKDIISYIKENDGGNNVIITIGAGDIYKIGEDLI